MLEENITVEPLGTTEHLAAMPEQLISRTGGKAEPTRWSTVEQHRKVRLRTCEGKTGNANRCRKGVRQPLMPEVIHVSVRKSTAEPHNQSVGQLRSVENCASAGWSAHYINAVGTGLLERNVGLRLGVADRNAPRLPPVEAYNN
jgi:hypothetical protein